MSTSTVSNTEHSISAKIRVAHLVSHPIQYFVPLYRALSERPEIDLTVYFFSVASLNQHVESGFGRVVDWDIPLTGGYHYELKGDAATRPLRGKPDYRPNWGILAALLRGRYDVIWVHGYTNGNAWPATLIGRLTGTPVLLRDDQTLLTPRSRTSQAIKRLILPILFRNIKGLYVGRSNQAYFEKYGSKTNFRVSHSVDNSFFQEQQRTLAPIRNDLRRHFGILNEAPVILFSGKFVDKKKPLLLLDAFREVRRDMNCHLLLVGDGPLRSALEEQIRTHSIPNVHFAGFLNQSEISTAYLASDLLVLPSAYQETWGLVVNEAMNFGLPIVVSDRVGCAADLVEEGRNGFLFCSGDVGDLASQIRKLLSSKELRNSFGRRSKEIVQAYSIRAVTDQMVEACLTSAGRKPQTTPRAERVLAPTK